MKTNAYIFYNFFNPLIKWSRILSYYHEYYKKEEGIKLSAHSIVHKLLAYLYSKKFHFLVDLGFVYLIPLIHIRIAYSLKDKKAGLSTYKISDKNNKIGKKEI